MNENLCPNCVKRPATENWVGEGGTLAFSHGMYQRWCKICVLTEQIKYLTKVSSNLPALKKQLKKLTK